MKYIIIIILLIASLKIQAQSYECIVSRDSINKTAFTGLFNLEKKILRRVKRHTGNDVNTKVWCDIYKKQFSGYIGYAFYTYAPDDSLSNGGNGYYPMFEDLFGYFTKAYVNKYSKSPYDRCNFNDGSWVKVNR